MTKPSNIISSQMKQYLNLVVDPITTTSRALCPDGHNHDALLARDYEIGKAIQALAAASGVFIWLEYGYEDATDLYFSPDAGDPNTAWRMNYVFLDGSMLPMDLGTTQYIISQTGNMYDKMNLDSISTASIATAYRVIAGGLRVLPKIEMVTTTDVNYVRRYFAGQINLRNIYQALVDGSQPMDQLISSSDQAMQFGNNDGACARINPFQDPNMLMPRPFGYELIKNSGDRIYQNLSQCAFPAICVQFTQSVAVFDFLPIYIDWKVYVELVIQRPTPLLMSNATVDLFFDEFARFVTGHPETWPLVSKGHSFRPIGNILSKIGTMYVTAAKQSTSPSLRREFPSKKQRKEVQSIVASATALARHRGALPPKKKKKKKGKGKGPKQPNFRKVGTKPGGVRN